MTSMSQAATHHAGDAHDAAQATTAMALEDFVASIQHLPLFTGMAAQLVTSVDREDVSTTELARLISGDAALVAQLLRLVNSPYYGLRRSVGTVTDAILVLGLNTIRRVVSAAVLQRPLFAYLHDTAVARSFWRHQMLTALLARHVHADKGMDGEIAYMAGLLHDVGRLAMLVKFPQDHDALLADRAGEDHVVVERVRFGFDHAIVGAALLELWDVPGPMVMATAQHEDDDEPEDALAASVWLANRLSHRFFEEASDDMDSAPPASRMLAPDVRARIVDEIAAFESLAS